MGINRDPTAGVYGNIASLLRRLPHQLFQLQTSGLKLASFRYAPHPHPHDAVDWVTVDVNEGISEFLNTGAMIPLKAVVSSTSSHKNIRSGVLLEERNSTKMKNTVALRVVLFRQGSSNTSRATKV